jgi:hypothetical protein
MSSRPAFPRLPVNIQPSGGRLSSSAPPTRDATTMLAEVGVP